MDEYFTTRDADAGVMMTLVARGRVSETAWDALTPLIEQDTYYLILAAAGHYSLAVRESAQQALFKSDMDKWSKRDFFDFTQVASHFSEEQLAGIFRAYLSVVESKLSPDELRQLIELINSLPRRESDFYSAFLHRDSPKKIGKYLKSYGHS